MPTKHETIFHQMPLGEYFLCTEAAVRAQFSALNVYNAETRPPRIKVDATGLIINSEEECREYVERVTANRQHYFAKAIVCGTILQVAYVAIKEYSQNKVGAGEFPGFDVKPDSNAAKYCVGRLVHGIPLGLMVFAARNQFNHWEEGVPNSPVTKAVFEKLYLHYRFEPTRDLVYSLGWIWNRPVAHHVVLDELGWRSYEKYLDDMRLILPNA